MVVVDLAPGDHTIKWTLSGYSQLTAIINVGSTGIVTCKSVTGGSCGSSISPGVLVSGSTITGYILYGVTPTPSNDMCSWIVGLGGWDAIKAYDIMSLVGAYSGNVNIGFTVTSASIMGAVAYYSGNASSGNSLTGCVFT